MRRINPKLPKKGGIIEFIAPAGIIEDRKPIDRAKKYLEAGGYEVKYSKHLFGSCCGYFSGNDNERLSDLHNAFADKSVDAVICARGGYGCLRLIKEIDYDLIKKNPKLFCGYSDITVLSAMFLKYANLITYSAPMAKGDFGAESVSCYTMEHFFNAVEKKGELRFSADRIYKDGAASGIMFGGNLSSIASLCGTDFIPDEKFIFFAEDLNEPVYKIDKMLTQLFNIENFKNNISGMILGDFLDNGNMELLDELIKSTAQKYNIPALGGFKITHEKDKITIPCGSPAVICGSELVIEN